MFEDEVYRRIGSIQFGLFGPEEIRRGSVVHVIHPETLEGGVPKEGGLIDLRMGTTERTFLCQTCNLSSYECTGHYGHVELARPMFHVGYISRIKKTLECVCFYCSRLKVPKASLPRGLSACWDALKGRNICEGEPCDIGTTGCGNRQPIIRREGLNLAVFMKGEDGEGKVLLNGEKVYAILKKITVEDFEFLGFHAEFSRPEWMLLTTVLVPPPSMRPSIVMNGTLRAEDDLTHKLADIVKANAHLRRYEQEGAPGHIVRDYEQLLQFHLATFVDNDIGGQPQSLQKNGRPLKCISARLKGKEGRVRGNLMGKRVDFSARSVITPDPNISCSEVGVPVHVAQIHTFPERVTNFNMLALQRLVSNGPALYPGANYVVRNDGQRIDLAFNRGDLRLEQGAIVERHMQDGDPVLFNRQPSLHKMSMMGHRAKIMTGKTFRLNLSVTAPYNADFDGDEMNLHMPQSHNTRSELSSLTNVAHQIVSPQSNTPVIGIVQDATIGSRLFTLRDTFFKRSEAMSLLFSVNGLGATGESFLDYMVPAILQPVPLWTGKQIFSSILPLIFYDRECNFSAYENDKNIVSTFNSPFFLKNLNDNRVLVRNGRLLKGVIDKKFVGAQQGGCIHVIHNDIGSEAAKSFIDNVQKLINHFMFHISSFSIGIGDCIADSNTLLLCQESISRAMADVDLVIESAKKGELEKLPGMGIAETLESSVNVILNKARDVSGTGAQESLNSQNNMKSMVIAGSKGSYINISQMTTCVGQQNVEGRRIPFGFASRALPHFLKYDYSAKARGFVESSYLCGLSAPEFFFHAMGGREGLIDTAIKTAETGYIQRRLVKALEGATVHHDSSVRTEDGSILQFVYGDDAFDATHLENVALPRLSEQQFKMSHFMDNFIDTAYATEPSTVSSDVYSLLQDDSELQKLLDVEYSYLFSNRDILPSRYASPVNIQRLLLSSSRSKSYCSSRAISASIPATAFSSPSPYRILKEVQSLMVGNRILDYYIRLSLSVKTILSSCTESSFSSLMAAVRKRLLRSHINASEMVGTLAAQSVGEPATQMTLNTFHLAGVASQVTTGVPRLNEIINVARSIRTPSMRVVLQPEYAENVSSARAVQTQIEHCSLRDVCTTVQILYDPDIRTTVLPADRPLVDSYFEMPDDDVDYDSFGHFVIRLELSRAGLVARGLGTEAVSARIRSIHGNTIHIIASDENEASPVVRVRLTAGSGDDIPFYRSVAVSMMKIRLRGLENIKKAALLSTPSGWVLQTDGIALTPLLSHAAIDGSKLSCNDPSIVSAALGIEAARQAILNELTHVIEGNGSYVNHRHMALLADVMTVRGFLTGITRHGVNRAGAGALRRASFEQTVDILLDAAVGAEVDKAAGITENIMMGQLAPLGTGAVELILDLKKLDVSTLEAPAVASPPSDSSAVAWSPRIAPGSSTSSGWSPPGFSPDVSPLYQSSSGYSPVGLSYSPVSPSYSPASPSYSPNSPLYSPASPSYSPNSPLYSPVSPSYNPASPSYSPASPSYNPTSPSYSPASPSYNPMSPSYSPASPSYSPTSPSYSPASPSYSPSSYASGFSDRKDKKSQ